MITNEQKKFMKRAIELAENNIKTMEGGPFGALVVKDGKIIAEASNQVLVKNDPTAHAEVVAIRKACKILNTYQLDGCEIYASCEPCPMCFGAIYWARPDGYFYAANRHDAANANFDDSIIYDELELGEDQRKIPTKQIMQTEAQQAFTKWKTSTNKIPY